MIHLRLTVLNGDPAYALKNTSNTGCSSPKYRIDPILNNLSSYYKKYKHDYHKSVQC